MPVTVDALLAASELQLRCLTAPDDGLDRTASWVSTTELPDPTPFLRGGELVMTTGLVDRSEREWARLLRGLAEVPVAALCFGTGLVHQQVPDTVVTAAREAGLVLLESPTEVPFVQISRWVADRIFAEQYDAVERTVAAQDNLLAELVAGHGMPGLLRRLHSLLKAGAVAVIDDRGRVLGLHPARSDWAPSAPEPDDTRLSRDDPIRMPVMVNGRRFATLCSQRASTRAALASYAATVLGLELARHQAVLTARRELVGQVIEDVVHRVLSESDARRRLLDHGLDVTRPHHVLLASAGLPADRLRELTWALGQPWTVDTSEPFVTALVEDALVLVVGEDVDVEGVAESVLRHLVRRVPEARVGVSAPRGGVAGLRLGFYEARQAARQGPGVHRAAPLSATGLLLGNLDLPLEDLGRSVLGPLLRHDRDHGSDLMRTLRCYFDHDCRVAPTVRALALHRNSLRYRLQRVERLTGRDLDGMQDRMELWFALAALDSNRHDRS
jgi:purine catabolism regulator